MSMGWRCGVCKKELRGISALWHGKPFPVCSKCRLMVHHGCLKQIDPPICRRCAEARAETVRN